MRKYILGNSLLCFVAVASALCIAGPASAQSFRSGYRGEFVSGNYFGPHRPFTGHRSNHIGYLNYSPHTYGTYYQPYRYSGYRSPRYGRYSESYSYSRQYQTGYGFHGRSYCAPYRSYYSPQYSLGYSTHFSTRSARSHGYGYGYGYRSGRSHYSTTHRRGAYGHSRGVYVLHGNAAWRATSFSPYPAVRPRKTPWRALMEDAYDRSEAGAERDEFLRSYPPSDSRDSSPADRQAVEQPVPELEREQQRPPPDEEAPRLRKIPRESVPAFDPGVVSASSVTVSQ